MEFYAEQFGVDSLPLLRRQPLFKGLDDSEIAAFIMYADPIYVFLFTGQLKLISPELSHTIGIVLSGSAHVYSVDHDGGRVMLRSLLTGDNSGSLYSMLDFENTLIEVEAIEPFEMLLVSPESILKTEPRLAQIQHKIAVNLIGTQRKAFFALSEHIACLSQRNIRDKVLRLLRSYSDATRSDEFTIPLSREEMASYLAVDRAALSRSLAALKAEGIIDFRKSTFKILDKRQLKY